MVDANVWEVGRSAWIALPGGERQYLQSYRQTVLEIGPIKRTTISEMLQKRSTFQTV